MSALLWCDSPDFYGIAVSWPDLTKPDLCCWPVCCRVAKHAAVRVPEPPRGVDWLGGIFLADPSVSVWL